MVSYAVPVRYSLSLIDGCPASLLCTAAVVYEKLKKEGALKEWNPEKEEELEDYDGNVYSKKMYEDLRRQGLITPRT